MADIRRAQGGISTWDEDNANEKVPQRFGPMSEFGVAGAKRVSGYVAEEFLPALRGRKAVRARTTHGDVALGMMLLPLDA